MADLPRSDLETDTASLKLRKDRRVPQLPYSSDEKQFSTMEDRVDSGVGYSLESQEFSALSFEGVRDYLGSETGKVCHRQMIDTYNSPSTTSDNLTSSLQNQLRNLSIGDTDQTKDCVKSNRCDSGICDSGNFSVEEPFLVQSAFAECHLLSSVQYDSTFSTQELEELFSQDEDGDTHLHMSIIHLLPDVSLKIISLAPSYDFINIPNNLHQTPLHLAVATRQLLIVRRLMAAGASLDAPDHCGNTPLHIACREGLPDMVRFLLQPVLHQETLANTYQIPYQRVPQDLSIRNYDGYTCAHVALQNGHLDILQLLLVKGANVNEPDGKSGRTLLHMAADMGYQEALCLLITQRDLNLNARTYGGLTAISLAHGRRLNDIVEWLYGNGADCSQLTEDSGESTDEEMNDFVYDDICINGQPVLLN
ncbi:NF-kappa-B inhibitor alpha-like isoform X1 [Littorina saxatilis]|uniref:Uncharacterized protein n=1 Tax=Littorina saxatilis TaxID=31220 RepID=A0AAN9GEM7_9CAEN